MLTEKELIALIKTLNKLKSQQEKEIEDCVRRKFGDAYVNNLRNEVSKTKTQIQTLEFVLNKN